MSAWAWVLVGVGVAFVVVLVAAALLKQRRTAQLRGRFGPEYEREVQKHGSKREAEAELATRVERREELDIHPLPAEARARYREAWTVVQAQFVDDPRDAIGEADKLVATAMLDRGYPMGDFEQRADDISVDYPEVVERYRSAHAIAQKNTAGSATTEDLRQGMMHYRALFDELLGPEDEYDRSNGDAAELPRDEVPTRTVRR